MSRRLVRYRLGRRARHALGTSLSLALVITAALAGPQAVRQAYAAVTDPASVVNTLIGSQNHGETVPGAATPFGMVQWSPENTAGDQTQEVEPGGYSYDDPKIRGFSLTHLSGTGCAGASGDVPFLPITSSVSTSPSSDTSDATYASTFSHANETATAGYYKVGLDSGVTVELSATTHTGAGRITYPTGSPASLLVRTSNSEVGSSAASTTIDAAASTISGSVTSGNFCGYINPIDQRSYYTLYFVAAFDHPMTSTGTWNNGTVTAGGTSASGGTGWDSNGFPVAGNGSGGYVTFDTSAGSTVGVRVGISYVSQANAQANLNAENPAGTSFDTVRQQAHDAWNTALDRIGVSGGTGAQQATFYTALYHSLLHPNVFSDVNGQYMGMDEQVHAVSGAQKAQYANFSGWDVYRDQVQLVTLLEPDVGADMAQSLYNQASQNNGVWDRWTHNQGGTHVMTGDPGHAAVSSIYAFGGTSFDAAGALASMVHAATTVTSDDLSSAGWNVMVVGERPSLDKYLSLGYVPADSNAWGGAGETLEDGAADFGISTLAGRLGDTSTAATFLNRAQGWKKVFNAANGGYIQQRNSDGTWPSFSPGTEDGFAEGSAAQYTWMVPYNVNGLFTAMGGNATAASRLDQYFHNADGTWALTGGDGTTSDLSNEPSIGDPWLYDFAGQPYQTQNTVRQVVDTLWSDTPGGIPGQDDLGAMSSWYVWAATGLYPLAPGRSELLLGSPLFTQVVVHRSNGVTITVNAPAAATGAPYVQSLNVNGAPSTKPWLPESFVAGGGTLDETLGTSANTSWGAAASDAPPSFDTGSAPGNDFSLAVGPSSGSVVAGSSATATVNTAVVSGSAQSVALSAGGLPTGATASFSPSSVTAGGSSTVTISTSASTPAGTYPVSITGSAGSATHSVTYALTVTGSSGGGISNGPHTLIASGKALDDPNHSTTAGTQLITWTPTGGSNQSWVFTQQSDGSYQIVNGQSNLCIDVSGASTSPGAQVIQWTCHGGANQHWIITPLTSGSGYTIASQNSGLLLTTASNADGSLVTQQANSGSALQQWTIS
ncbi:putative alpha-1,2-mannosidase [Catenulispora sp. EB89]|uniref:GH92 family glycosyl hydrolase n=1 Tax=Catenulispora sp. EB89 TaxID=3156257 RepID=UPI0035169624